MVYIAFWPRGQCLQREQANRLLASIWLVELSDQLPPSVELDGFDLSASQYPAGQWLPANVALRVHDAFTPFPKATIGKYDVVHVALFITLIKNNDPGPLIRNLVTLLSKQPA